MKLTQFDADYDIRNSLEGIPADEIEVEMLYDRFVGNPLYPAIAWIIMELQSPFE